MSVMWLDIMNSTLPPTCVHKNNNQGSNRLLQCKQGRWKAGWQNRTGPSFIMWLTQLWLYSIPNHSLFSLKILFLIMEGDGFPQGNFTNMVRHADWPCSLLRCTKYYGLWVLMNAFCMILLLYSYTAERRDVQPNTSWLEAVYGHSLIINPYQGMYQEIHLCRVGSIDSVKINTSLLVMREWVMHPRQPRDFPRPERCLEGHLEGWGKSWGDWGCITQHIPPLGIICIQYQIACYNQTHESLQNAWIPTNRRKSKQRINNSSKNTISIFLTTVWWWEQKIAALEEEGTSFLFWDLPPAASSTSSSRCGNSGGQWKDVQTCSTHHTWPHLILLLNMWKL